MFYDSLDSAWENIVCLSVVLKHYTYSMNAL